MDNKLKTKLHNEFTLLYEVIEKLTKDKMVYYMPNPGNLGDGLIMQGTLDFFNHYNISYRIVEPEKPVWMYLKDIFKFRNSVLIYGGGGGWCHNWNYPYRLLQTPLFKNVFEKIIILPSTYEISFLSNNIKYLARDKYESLVNNPAASYFPDMAFYLINRISSKEKDPYEYDTGYFLRTDKESKGIVMIPDNNVDISLMWGYKSDIFKMVNFLKKYKTIHTDRLHVAICGSIIGREVILYPGNYFKNKAIYNSTLKQFSNVKWYEDE